MLRIEFNTFQSKLAEDRQHGHLPTVHCLSDVDRFVFVIKSSETLDYYSIVFFEDIRQFAEKEGLKPEDAFSQFILNYCRGTMPLVKSDFEAVNIDTTEEIVTKQNEIIDAGPEVIEEAEDYEDLMQKHISKWETKVLNALSKLELNKSIKIDKTFGEFLERLHNAINSVPFLNQLHRVIKSSMKQGISSAEEELDLDLGFTVQHDRQAKIFENQQLNGYTINGKKWHGIKGASQQMRLKILNAVDEAVKDKKTLSETTKDVKKIFTTAKNSQAVMIARTETNRFIHQSKLLSYKESGIVQKKKWSTALDDRTSPICRRLNGQEVGLDEAFIDPETNKEYLHPPAHPNCRSVFKAVLK